MFEDADRVVLAGHGPVIGIEGEGRRRTQPDLAVDTGRTGEAERLGLGRGDPEIAVVVGRG